ncbi:hypothetical protein [Photobacterium angustum]|nr:hypothetical protein [Photobacterium angustum]
MHCGISIVELERLLKLQQSEDALIRAQNAVKDKYINGEEVLLMYKSYISNGFDKLEKIGRKYWLINNENRGFEIRNKILKNYIEIELLLLNLRN